MTRVKKINCEIAHLLSANGTGMAHEYSVDYFESR
jgi:hypothetical protein